LTKHLSKNYTGYNYDFFLKEVEDLQKEGKVEVQLIAGKLYIQIKKTYARIFVCIQTVVAGT